MPQRLPAKQPVISDPPEPNSSQSEIECFGMAFFLGLKEVLQLLSAVTHLCHTVFYLGVIEIDERLLGG